MEIPDYDSVWYSRGLVSYPYKICIVAQLGELAIS